MPGDQRDHDPSKWDPPLTPYLPWGPEHPSRTPRPLAKEISAILLLVPLTPVTVLLLIVGREMFARGGQVGHFVESIGLLLVRALFFGFRESLLGSLAIVCIGGILARFRIDSVWVSLMLGAVVGLAVRRFRACWLIF